MGFEIRKIIKFQFRARISGIPTLPIARISLEAALELIPGN